MAENVAFVAPAWLWIGAVTILFCFGGLCAWLLSWALNLRHVLDRLSEYERNAAMRVDVQREFGVVHTSLLETRRELGLEESHSATLPSVWPEPDT
jgi:hypothetical protein